MSSEKQIEEMARAMCGEYAHCCGECDSCGMCEFWTEASRLFEAGYRKQSEGEWVSVEGDVIFKCSICDAEISTSWDYENDDMWGFCPCCGANMKGGEGK